MPEEKKHEIRWWDTSRPFTFLGLSPEPFVLVVFMPMLPFGPVVSFIGWLLVMNVIISWVFRKNLTQFLHYCKRLFFNNRRRIHNSKHSLRRYKGY